MTENNDAANQQENGGAQKQEQQAKAGTFTAEQQAEVNRIVQERVQRVEAKYADYGDLKAKADSAKTVEQKLADLAAKHAEAEARALRSDIAAKYGVSAEDRDLFLTGSDETALEAQAKRLADRAVDQKKNGNRAPKEGSTTNGEDKDKGLREFTRTLFASAQTD